MAAASEEMIKPATDNALQALEGFTPEQVDILRNHVASPDFTNDELKYCMGVAKARGLDPFKKEIYFTKRRQFVGKGKPGADRDGFSWKVAAEPTIDGFRSTAEKTGEMDGYDDPLWCGKDGVWLDVWLSKDPPAAAKVRVYRKGRQHPYTAVARFDEYVVRKAGGETTSMWSKMPANQIAKCAEALALRKAFPSQFAGIYTKEEMEQADNNRFDVIPQEREHEALPEPKQEARAEVVQMAPKTAKPAQSMNPNRPPKWTTADALPDMILKSVPALRPLKGVPLSDMAEDDLELVVEQGKKAYELWAATSGAAPKALALLQEILVSAEVRVSSFRGDAPPPIADDSQSPADFDPETGEVMS